MNAFRTLGLVAPLALAAAGSAQTVLLRFKPPVGKTAAYTMTMSMTQNVPGMAAPMSFTQTIPMTLRVVSRSGGLTTLQTKMGQAKVSLPAGSPMAAAKAQMEKQTSGLTTTTTVDELGNLKNVNAAGAGAAASMARGMGAGMMSGAQGVSYPKQALKVGDTWGATMDMGKMMGGMMGGAIKASGKFPIVYRLVSVSGNVATVSVKMNGRTTMNVGTNAMQMALSTQGTMRVDSATGLLQSMTTTSITDMTLGAAGQKMRQNMVMSMKAR